MPFTAERPVATAVVRHRSGPAANAADGPAELAARADVTEHIQLLLVDTENAFPWASMPDQVGTAGVRVFD